METKLDDLVASTACCVCDTCFHVNTEELILRSSDDDNTGEIEVPSNIHFTIYQIQVPNPCLSVYYVEP